MRIGLIFGSFNPVHNGHIAIGKRVLDEGLVDCVHYVIAKQNPFKPNYGVSFEDRERMLAIALVTPVMEGYKMFAQPIEKFTNENHTFNTLSNLKDILGYDNEYVIICGIDMYNEIPLWYHGQEILDNYKFVVFKRDGYGNTTAGVIYLETNGQESISSSTIRKTILDHNNGRLKGSLTDTLDGEINMAVLSYIQQFNIYWMDTN